LEEIYTSTYNDCKIYCHSRILNLSWV